MITRTQAEALLTLAESLEACERLGVKISPPEDAMETTLIEGEGFSYFLETITGNSIKECLQAYGIKENPNETQ